MALKVEGHSDLYRDPTTQGIYNTDRAALLTAKRIKKEKLEEKQRLDKMEEKISTIESTMTSILDILKSMKDKE